MTMQRDRRFISFLNKHDGRRAHLVGPVSKTFNVIADPFEPVIFVDGGAALREHCPYPSISIGDGDSSHAPMDILLNPDKAFSDLAFALLHLQFTEHNLHLHGFLGERRDHEYFNIGEVYAMLRKSIATRYAHFNHEIYILGRGSWELQINGTFSLATLMHNIVQMTGDCRYPIAQAKNIMPLSSYCLSNMGTGQIQIQCQQPIILFLTPETKFGIIHVSSSS